MTDLTRRNHAIYGLRYDKSGRLLALNKVPRDAQCRACSIKGVIEDCYKCSGVGRAPIPISEIMAEGWRFRRYESWGFDG